MMRCEQAAYAAQTAAGLHSAPPRGGNTLLGAAGTRFGAREGRGGSCSPRTVIFPCRAE